MAIKTIEHGQSFVTSANRKIRVGIIGGIHDKKRGLLTNAQPLIEAGYKVAVLEGGWLSGEKTRQKLTRAERFLDGWQPDVLYGPSAGGLLAIIVGFNHPSVHRIITAASPLRWPRKEENTPKLRTIQLGIPAFKELRDRYYEQVKDHLGETRQQFLHIRGTHDELVPPALSLMEGADKGMPHIEHVVFTTPSKIERKSWAHTYTTREALRWPKVHEFIAGAIA